MAFLDASPRRNLGGISFGLPWEQPFPSTCLSFISLSDMEQTDEFFIAKPHLESKFLRHLTGGLSSSSQDTPLGVYAACRGVQGLNFFFCWEKRIQYLLFAE